MTEAQTPTTDHEQVSREITINAPLDDVWETVSTDAGRERWLEPDPDRRLVVETTEAPDHVSWWWWQETDNEPARHVDVRLVPDPASGGTRVTVTECQPSLVPLARMATACDTNASAPSASASTAHATAARELVYA